MGGLAEGTGAEAAEAIAGGVGLAGGGCGVWGVEEVALLGTEEEEVSIDQSEELLEVVVRGEGAIIEAADFFPLKC